jgi:hypothetical protein
MGEEDLNGTPRRWHVTHIAADLETTPTTGLFFPRRNAFIPDWQIFFLRDLRCWIWTVKRERERERERERDVGDLREQ